MLQLSPFLASSTIVKLANLLLMELLSWRKGPMVEILSNPLVLVIFMRFITAGMSIVTKSALNQGMDQRVFIVYRYLFASAAVAPFALLFERKTRPKITIPVLVKVMLLGLLEPVIDQNLYYAGMKYTTATFSAAMCNILPAFAFLLAWIFRLEKVNVRRVHSQAKIVGTVVTVAGAMVMTLVKGTVIGLPWTRSGEGVGNLVDAAAVAASSSSSSDVIKGALLIVSGCFFWACFFTLQAITLKSYPADLSLTALICWAGTVEAFIYAIAYEGGINAAAWTLHLDIILLSVLYSGVICSGFTYYIQSKVMQTQGPVFVTAFTPLTMVIVTILGSLFLHEILYLGRLIGSIVIVVGLYLVLWGKSKDDTQSDNEEESVPSVEEDDIEATKEITVSSISNGGSVEMNSFVAVYFTDDRSNDHAASGDHICEDPTRIR